MHTFGKYIAVVVSLIPLVAYAAFSDVPSTHPNYSAINYVQLQGIVQGYADGTYGPSKTINRAEFTKILIAARYSPVTITSCDSAPFGDVPTGEWFTPYVCVAFNQGIIGGYADGTFKPTNTVNMGEAAKIIVRAFNLPAVSTDSPALDLYRSGFAIAGSQDEKLNPYWWQYYLVVLNTAGALPSSYRGPDQPVTRAEMAEMIYRVMSENDSTPVYIPPASSASSATSLTPASLPGYTPPTSTAISSKHSSSSAAQITGGTTAEVSIAAPAGGTIVKGDPFTVVYTVRNNGPDFAKNVQIIGAFPYQSDFDAALSDHRCFSVNQSPYNVYCNLGDMQDKSQTDVAISMKTDRILCPNTLTQSMTVDSDTQDPVTNNNADNTAVHVDCPVSEVVDLSPEIVSPSRVQPGTRATFSYYVHNNATATAYSTSIRITIPAGMTFVPTSSSQTCSLKNGEIVCNLGHIPGMSEGRADIAYDATCASDEPKTTMNITTTSQNTFTLQPLTVSVDCY